MGLRFLSLETNALSTMEAPLICMELKLILLDLKEIS